jgi:hypothetical protein
MEANRMLYDAPPCLVGVEVPIPREDKSSGVSERDARSENLSTADIKNVNLLAIFAAVLDLIGQIGPIRRDAIDTDGGIWSFRRRIDEQPFYIAVGFPDIDATLFCAPAPLSIEVVVTHACRLIDHLDIEIEPDTPLQHTHSWTSRKVGVAAPLLLANPEFGLGQAAVFEPPVRVTDCCPVDEVFGESLHRHRTSRKEGSCAARSICRARLLA